MQVEEQVVQRRDPEDQPRQREEEVVERAEVGRAVSQREAASEQRVVAEENLQAAEHPAPPLHDVRREVLGRETDGERLVEVYRAPAGRVQVRARVDVL